MAQINVDLQNGWILQVPAGAGTVTIPTLNQSGATWARGQEGVVSKIKAKHAAYAADSHPTTDTEIGGDYTSEGYEIWTRNGPGTGQDTITCQGTWSVEVTGGGWGNPEADGFIDTHVGFASTNEPTGVEYSVSYGRSLTSAPTVFQGIVEAGLVSLGIDPALAASIAASATLTQGSGLQNGGGSVAGGGVAFNISSFYFETDCGVIYMDRADAGLTSYSIAHTVSELKMSGSITLN